MSDHGAGVTHQADDVEGLEATAALIQAETDKIDSASSDGLSGTSNSVAYRVAEIERHWHGYQRMGGLAAAPVGETHRADFDSMSPFVLDAGNDTWGAWLQLIGSDDTPVDAGNVYFDPDEVVITDVERANTIYRVQIAAGDSGAAALAAGTYTEFIFETPANVRQAPFPIRMRRQAVGTKIWGRCWADGANTGEMDIFISLHEYEG